MLRPLHLKTNDNNGSKKRISDYFSLNCMNFAYKYCIYGAIGHVSDDEGYFTYVKKQDSGYQYHQHVPVFITLVPLLIFLATQIWYFIHVTYTKIATVNCMLPPLMVTIEGLKSLLNMIASQFAFQTLVQIYSNSIGSRGDCIIGRGGRSSIIQLGGGGGQKSFRPT